VHYYRAALVQGPRGASAEFAFADGASRGVISVTLVQWSMAAVADAYVTDVQLGTYEWPDRGSRFECSIDPTFHFYCPATGATDQLCITWSRRNLAGIPG
jgi:hypothetical protein